MKTALKQLWLTYKTYGELSVNRKYKPEFDSSAFATASVQGFLDYCKEGRESYGWHDLETIIANEIRIYKGLIECYDREVKRVSSNKTRWCL